MKSDAKGWINAPFAGMKIPRLYLPIYFPFFVFLITYNDGQDLKLKLTFGIFSGTVTLLLSYLLYNNLLSKIKTDKSSGKKVGNRFLEIADWLGFGLSIYLFLLISGKL